MNSFDASILHFFNQFSQKSIAFDYLMDFVTGANLLKGGVFLAAFWAWWLVDSPDQQRRREVILASLVGCALALLAARSLAIALPHRDRPFTVTSLHLLPPAGSVSESVSGAADSLDLDKWSSFPSDHAALFLGMTTTCFLISRRAGWMALLYTFIFIILPRIYLGFHAPTDLLAGGLLGWLAVILLNRPALRAWVSGIGFRWLARAPFSFYVSFFLATYQFVVLFADIRIAGGDFKDMLSECHAPHLPHAR